MTIIKALTISQPYASLIARGEKSIENRNWPTNYRGRLAIHAGKGTQYLTPGQLRGYPTGCVIATAQLVACIPLEPVRVHRRSAVLEKLGISVESVLANKHAEGPWCWILQDVRALRVVCPCRGSQGLWDWDEAEMMLSGFLGR
jgi:hypothetical protein